MVFRTHQYEILDEVRDAAVGDDEEPGDGPGHGLLRNVRLAGGGARGVALTAAADHQLERSRIYVSEAGTIERSIAFFVFFFFFVCLFGRIIQLRCVLQLHVQLQRSRHYGAPSIITSSDNPTCGYEVYTDTHTIYRYVIIDLAPYLRSFTCARSYVTDWSKEARPGRRRSSDLEDRTRGRLIAPL